MSELCRAVAQWGRLGHSTVRKAHPCGNSATHYTPYCIHHERQLVRALTSSSGFYRRKVFRNHFPDIQADELTQVEEAWSVKCLSMNDPVTMRSNLDMMLSIIRLFQPITISILTEKVNQNVGYAFSKKQVGKALSTQVKEGLIVKGLTTSRALTEQASEVVYSLPDIES